MTPTGRIHACRHIKPGGRLDRVRQLLLRRGQAGATTLEIIKEAGVCAVSAIASELRANGIQVDCQPEGRDALGAAIYRYRLVEQGEPVQQELFARRGA